MSTAELSVGETLVMPVLPLRDVVVFPHMVIPLFVGRKKSIIALEHATQNNKYIYLYIQIDKLPLYIYYKLNV